MCLCTCFVFARNTRAPSDACFGQNFRAKPSVARSDACFCQEKPKSTPHAAGKKRIGHSGEGFHVRLIVPPILGTAKTLRDGVYRVRITRQTKTQPRRRTTMFVQVRSCDNLV